MATALELPSLDTLREEQRAIRAVLVRLRRRLRVELALELVADAALVLSGTAALLVFLDWWFRFGLPVRVILLTLALLGVLAFLGTRAFRRLQAARLDELTLAMTLDRHRPGTGQQIADVLQLPELLDEADASASPAMVRLAVQRAVAALAGSDWRMLWNRKRSALAALAVTLGLLVPLCFVAIAPRAARLSAARWLFGSSQRWPQRTYLTVMGLNGSNSLLAPRDERFQVEVRSDLPLIEPRGSEWIVHGRGEPTVLWSRPAQPKVPSSVLIKERVAEGKVRNGAMTESGPARFTFDVPPSSQSSVIDFVGGDDWLGPFTVERVDRPSLADTKLRVKEPGATYTGFRTVEDPRQHLLFLVDTEIELTLVGTEPISESQVKIQAGKSLPLERTDERTFTTRWKLTEATTLEILLTSARTRLPSKPTFLSIGLLKDRLPRVTLRALGTSGHVTPIATIPLSISATDDFGLGALRLQVDRTTSSDDKSEPVTKRASQPMPLPLEKDRPLLDYQVRHEVTLQIDPPRIGTIMRFVAEADDRCAHGAQTGRSSALHVQVVSPDELFYEILIRQRAERAKFLFALEAIEKQTPVLAGQPKSADFQTVMRVHHTAARQLDQIAGRVADTLQEMKLNQVGSPKSHRLLQQAIIEPIRALSAGPMSQVRNVLQALSGAASTPGATEAEARRLHAEVVANMRNILEQMSQWESFVDVVNQVAEVIKMQQKVLKETEKARDLRRIKDDSCCKPPSMMIISKLTARVRKIRASRPSSEVRSNPKTLFRPFRVVLT
jgi:hypothetical protein